MKKNVFVLTILIIMMVMISTTSIFANSLPETDLNLEFDNVKLEKVFEGLGKISGVNIMLGANMDKEVSYNLKGINFKTAINMITKSEDLAYIYKNNILVIDNVNKIDKYTEDKTGQEQNIVAGGGIIVDNQSSFGADLVINKGGDKGEEEKPFNTVEGINKGQMIPAKLDVGLISSEQPVPALVKVTQNIAYKGDIIIPKGAMFIGKGRTDYSVRKIFIDLNTLVIDNKEIDIKAHLVKNNGTPGFQSEYRDLSKENFWSTLLMEFAGSLGNRYSEQEESVKYHIFEKGQDGLDTLTEQMKADAEKKGEIITVESGYNGFVFIDEKIPLEYFKSEERGE